MLKSNGKRDGNNSRASVVTTIDGIDEPSLKEPFGQAFENPEFTESVIDVEGADGPAIEPKSQHRRRRRRLIRLGALLFVVITAFGLGIYLLSSPRGRTRIQMLVRDRRQRERDKQKQAGNNPDAITAEAIAEARRAAGSDIPDPRAKPDSISSAPSVLPPTTPPPLGKSTPNIAGTVTGPVTNTGVASEQLAGPLSTSSQTIDGIETSTSPSTTKGQTSQRNAERSFRLDIAQPKPTPSSVPTPASTPELTSQGERQPLNPAERVVTLKSTKEAQTEKVLPSFGSMLPVKTLGALLTLRTGALARLELTRDVKGEGWSMQRGTTLVGSVRGSQNDRAYVSLIGFIDPDSHKLVRLSGDVLGGDGGSGLRGQKRKVGNAWSRVFGGIAGAGVSLAGQMVEGLGRRTVVVTDNYGRMFYPVSNEVNGLVSGRARREFVEVAAGSTGYVMVTGLPRQIKGVDAPAGANADLDEEIALLMDGVDSQPTGLTEQELADLMANGTSEDIRLAMPRMTSQMRAIAQAVLEQPQK